MRVQGWMHKILMQKNVTLLPLVCGPLLCSPSLLLLPQQDRTKLIFSALISHTYLDSNFYCLQHDNLLEGSYSIHRQVWWTLMAKLGLRVFGSTSSISTWCNEFGQNEGERQAQHVGRSMTIYFISDVRKHNPLRCLPCPTSTLQHVIF